MTTPLLVINIAYIVTTIVTLVLGFFVYFNAPKRNYNIAFILFAIALAIFTAGHVVGVNSPDPDLSRKFLFLHLSYVFVAAFNAHWVLGILEKFERRKYAVGVIYTAAIALSVFYVLFPETFLLSSKPFLYFPNFYVLGSHHFLSVIFVALVVGYTLIELTQSYLSADGRLKNRINYFWMSFLFGYGLGMLPLLPAYGIPLDPIPSAFMWLYALPIGYAMLRYDLLDIEVLAKRAFQYSVLVILVGLIIISINALSEILQISRPEIPSWIIPMLSAVVVVGVSNYIWKTIRDVDVLKYEFVTVITHKFRTPLTHIRLSAQDLQSEVVSPEDRKKAAAEILKSNTHLVELTSAILDLNKMEGANYSYKFAAVNVALLLSDLAKAHEEEASRRRIAISVSAPLTNTLVSADEERLRLALNILIENAIVYNVEGGSVHISFEKDHQNVIIKIRDSGIGIDPLERKYIFNKFYRGKKAKLTDTEGVGVALYMAKEIVERNGGELWLESEGEGKGTTAFVALPEKR